MKRIFTLILAFSFFVLCGISVSAESENKANVVGSDTVGETDITEDKSATGNIYVAVVEKVSRYAIDVTFQQLSFTVNGGAIWNVNTLQYDFIGEDETENTQQFVCTVTVTNHSDKAIYTWGAVPSVISGVTVTPSANYTSKLIVDGATQTTKNEDGSIKDQGKATEQDLTFTLNPQTTWIDVGGLNGETVQLCTVSIYVGKSDT